MAVLRKSNSHSVDICRLIKNRECRKRYRRKTNSNFDFSRAAMCSRGFNKKECYVKHIIRVFLQQRTT